MTYLLLWLWWVFVTTHGLSLAVESGSSLVAAHGLLSVVAALTVDHRFCSVVFSSCGTQLSCPKGCGIFLNQGLNWCPLHWQGDS